MKAAHCGNARFVCLFLSLAAIALGATPLSAIQYAYITNPAANTVTVMDTTTKNIVTTIAVGEWPTGVAITPNGAFAYVTNYRSYTVSVIDLSTNVVSETLAVGYNPQMVAIMPDGSYAYVTNNGSNTVSAIDLASNTVSATIPVGANPALLVVTPDGAFVYVTNFGANTVSVIATATNTVVATIPVGIQPQCLVVTPDGAFVYVENRLSDTVSVISTDSNMIVATISLPAGSNPNGMGITPNGAFIYLSEWNTATVSVIDTVSNTIVATIPVGTYPCGASVTPDGLYAYIANSGDNTVSVINTATRTVIATVPAGATPVVIAFTPVVPPAPAVQFVPVTPCRLADTRSNHNPIQGGGYRAFVVPELGNCHIPITATAYSLNVTVVPQGFLGFLTIWPSGQHRPVVSTMNSQDGRYKAAAAIVPAGVRRAVSVFVSQTSDVILDINGYFRAGSSGTSQFYPVPPCRVIDTRWQNGDLGGPYLRGHQERDFPVLESSCGLPNTATAYSMNFTVMPKGSRVGYLSVWPKGQDQPLVSTLNDPTGTNVANAAIVPAGSGGAIATYATDDTNLVVDVDGYFAPPQSGGLSLYPMSPCRVIDTRQVGDGQPFTGELTVDVKSSQCAPPASSKAYVFNATAIPHGPLYYLTLWPDQQDQPSVSTLNAKDAAVTSNMAIVPNVDGKTDAWAEGYTQLILDISGYFAP